MGKYVRFIGELEGLNPFFIEDLESFNYRIPVLLEYPNELKLESKSNNYWVIKKSDKRFVIEKSIEITLDEGLFDI